MKAQPTTAPIAPMLPAPTPSPMDQVDIFAPVPMADGGVVGGLQDLGKMSGQMVEALNTVVYGGGPGGGGMGGGIAPVGGGVLVARCHLAVALVVVRCLRRCRL